MLPWLETPIMFVVGHSSSCEFPRFVICDFRNIFPVPGIISPLQEFWEKLNDGDNLQLSWWPRVTLQECGEALLPSKGASFWDFLPCGLGKCRGVDLDLLQDWVRDPTRTPFLRLLMVYVNVFLQSIELLGQFFYHFSDFCHDHVSNTANTCLS